MSDEDIPLPADPAQLSPLSIQAASLIRSIEALSNIFWISIGGTFLTIFFVGLSQLEVNATTDYIYLGEYQVPKSILPLASLAFAMFIFWMTANRLNMLSFVLGSTRLPAEMVHEIFHLNPPVLHVFDRKNADRWSPLTGVSVLISNWAVFFGNSIALTLASAAQRTASLADLDATFMGLYAMLTVVVITYGVRTIVPPLRNILGVLHGIDFHIGWPRQVAALLLVLLVVGIGNTDQLFSPSEQEDNLLGPAIANAIDGETLFMRGVEINLFGIDAVERDQVCQTPRGEDYPCGRAATQALQQLVASNDVVCLPFFAVSSTKVVATCRLLAEDRPAPMEPESFFLAEYERVNLSRIMVELGHALAVGFGEEAFAEEQDRAQRLRAGIWQGSFEPPASWRAHH